MAGSEEITYFLTDRQEAIWMEGDIHSGFPLNNVLTRFVIEGSINVDAFEGAFNRLFAQGSVFSAAVSMDTASGRRAFSLIEPLNELTVVQCDNQSVSVYEKSDDFQSWCQHRFEYDTCLYQAQLVQFSNNQFGFYLNQHYSITDEFSCYKIHQVLSDYYEQAVSGKVGSEAASLNSATFLDYLTEKKAERELGSFKGKEMFWAAKYETAVEPVRFYTQLANIKTAQSIRVSHSLDKKIIGLLNDMGQSVPVSVIFSSVLIAFLHRVSLNKDLSIGVPFVNRSKTHLETLGLFMEVCPNRVQVESTDTFADIVKKVSDEIEQLRDYQDHFVSAKKAAYEVVLNVSTGAPDSFAGLNAAYELTTPLNLLDRLEADIPRGDWAGREALSVLVNQSLDKSQYGLNFDFNLGVWPDTVFRARAIEHFCIILEQCLLSPEEKITNIDILTADERRLLFPPERSEKQHGEKLPTIIELFKKQLELWPEKAAIKFNDEVMTYRELDEQVTKLALQLSAMGVVTNVLVGVCVDRSPEMIVAVLAVMSAGGVYVPIDPKQPKDRIALILEDADPLITLTETVLRPKLGDEVKGRKIICLDDNCYTPEEGASLGNNIGKSNVAYITFTSGSTGRPKGVEVLHHGLVTLLLGVTEAPGISTEDTLLAVSTISFDIAAIDMFLPLINGATVRIVPYESTINGEKLRVLIEREEVTFFQATPASYRILIGAGWEGDNNLTAISTGEALPFELAQELLKRCGSLWNMYGPTETTIWSSGHEVKAEDSFISIGKAVTGTQLMVLDSELNALPIGVAGELFIAGAGVARGYYNNQALTDEKFISNPFPAQPNAKMYKTGDLVRYLSDLRLEYLGRIDFQVKIRGFRIELGEIETILGQYDAIKQCVVTTWPDSSVEQMLVAYVVPENTSELLDGLALREYLKGKLPIYMVPAKFIPLDSFPLTPNGKVDRKSLPNPDTSDIILQTSNYIAPKNDFELSLVVAWQAILNLEKVGVTDNFFELGGDSLMTVKLVHEMELATGHKFDIGNIFSHPTIEQLVNLQQSDSNDVASSIVPLQEKGDGVPLFCLCGINLYQDLADSLGETQPVYGIYVAAEQAFMNDLLAGKKSKLSVSDLAQAYSEAILRRQAQGPYQLAGISFGGLLAIETAQILRKKGAEVSVVILFDTILPSGIRRNLNGKLRQFVKNSLRLIKRTYVSVRKKELAVSDMAYFRERAYIKAMEACKLSGEYYSGQVILFKAKEKIWGPGVSLKDDYGWGEVLKNNMFVHEMEGDHIRIIKKPNVSTLANQLKAYLK